MLVKPKDPIPHTDKCGAIYQITCEVCNKVYIGETGRPLKKRISEHRRTTGSITTVGEHIRDTGHNMRWNDIKILGSETTWFSRRIKESIEIKTRNPEINDNSGYKLSPLYDTLQMDSTRQPSHPPH